MPALEALLAGVFVFSASSWILLLILLAVVPVAWFGSTAYRVGAGQSAVRFFASHVEVPAANGAPIRMERSKVGIKVTEMRVRIWFAIVPVAEVNRGYVIRFASEGQVRELSTLTLSEPKQTAALLLDLERFLRGEQATGVGPPTNAPASQNPTRTRDEYDEQLERDLRDGY